MVTVLHRNKSSRSRDNGILRWCSNVCDYQKERVPTLRSRVLAQRFFSAIASGDRQTNGTVRVIDIVHASYDVWLSLVATRGCNGDHTDQAFHSKLFLLPKHSVTRKMHSRCWDCRSIYRQQGVLGAWAVPLRIYKQCVPSYTFSRM